MTTTAMVRFECDRCGKVREIPMPREHDYYLHSLPPDGWVEVPLHDDARLLCGQCDRDLLTFFQGLPVPARPFDRPAIVSARQ